MDANLPETTGVDLVEHLVADPSRTAVPVVVYTSAALDGPLQRRLDLLAGRGVIRAVGAVEELFDVTALFLHRVASALPENRRTLLERLHRIDGLLTGRLALIVDDDVRNIFAMTSLLERHGMQVVSAETGREALEALRTTRDGSGADGHHAAGDGRLRDHASDSQRGGVTASSDHRADGEGHEGRPRAVHRSGASDYVAKPVDTERLLSTVRLWLTQ